MIDIIVELRVVEEHYVNGRYLQTYETLYRLCCDNKHCEEFSQSAMSILSRHNDLERSIATFSLELSQQDQRKREIDIAFQILISKMKKVFCPQQADSAYEEQALRMREQRTMLRKSLMAIEDDITDCINQKKIELLQQIKEQLLKVIEYFSNLIKTFRMVKDCE